jgi:TolB protein
MAHKKILLLIPITFLLLFPVQTKPQVTIRPTAGEELILAVADVQPAVQERESELTDTLKILNQVLWDDLKFAGYFTLAGKSFYPPQAIISPDSINYDSWGQLPFRVSFMSTGNVDIVGGVLRAELRLFDMKQRTMAFGERISGDTDQVRAIAHRWADEIVERLTAGASRGIASTKIAFVSRHGNAKEIHVMDYDGYDDRAFTRNSSLNLMPSWSPDGSKLAFMSYRTGKPEINLYSYLDGARLPFPMFNTLAMAPAVSPDGTEIIFAMRTSRGDTDLFIAKLDGSDRRDITNSPAIDTSPTWSPSGKQIAFTSDRVGGVNQIFVCDADGANVRSIIKEGGDADSPAWSPDGRYIAFHWKPRFGTSYDLYLVEVSSGKINQLTSESGSNESPSWAPDGRHLAFESNRSGSKQIYVMLLDRSEVRLVTSKGSNTSPAWGPYTRRN